MSLPQLRADRLAVLVFGPGVGELVAVHAPPGVWMLVDGCSADERSYATELLEAYGRTLGATQKVDIVLWTHPHTDHAGGLPRLLQHIESTPRLSWPLLGLLPPASSDPTAREARPRDYNAIAREGDVEHALARLRRMWRDEPTKRWEPIEGDRRALGNAMITVVSPTKKVHSTGRADPNRLSTAVLVEWGAHRVVLGSDLTRGGWSDALRFDSSLPAHTLFKVAHHGSKGALHASILAPMHGDATWVVTPFASRGLPRFTDGEAVEQMLRRVLRLHASSLPRPHRTQSAAPEVGTRSAIAEWPKIVFDPVTSGFPDCFVAVELGGSEPVLHHGPGSLRVER